MEINKAFFLSYSKQASQQPHSKHRDIVEYESIKNIDKTLGEFMRKEGGEIIHIVKLS